MSTADVQTAQTSLQDAVNVCLSVIGEAPVNSITGNSLPTQVALAKQTIEEVGRDIQSKGWWFNTTGANITLYSTDTSNNFHTSIPEEARRYITIRAARVLQSRFIGNEELHKFSYNEELVSLATLQQAHVRNGGNSTSFTKFPSTLKNLGIEEVMFLQGSAEEKLLTLRLDTELRQQEKITAEKYLLEAQSGTETQKLQTEIQETTRKTREAELLDTQETLVAQQKLTEVQETTKRTREHELLDAQEALIQKQILTEAEQAAKVQEEVDLLQAQDTLVQAQATDVAADTTLKGHQSTLVQAQATDVAADTTLKGHQSTLVQAQATDVAADTTLKGHQSTLVQAQATDVAADTTLKGHQSTLVQAQATDVAADTTLKGHQSTLVQAQATDVAADTTLKGKQGLLVDAQELKTDQETALLAQQRTTEVEVTNKTTQEATLITKQGALVDAQELKTDAETALLTAEELKTDAETTLTTKQGALVDAQELKTDAETTLTSKQGLLVDAQELKTDSEKALLDAQKTQVETQTALELTEEQSYSNAITGVASGTTYRDYASELRMMGVQETSFYALPAYKKKEALKDAIKMRTVSATETGTDAKEIEVVNNIRRMIGEMPITALNGDSMASEAVRMLRKTSKELQGRGWWFNAEYDVSLSPSPDNLGNNTVIYVSSKDSTSFEGYYVRQNSFSSGSSTSSAQYYIGTTHRIKIQSVGYSGGTIYDIDFVGLNDNTVAGNLGSITSSVGSWGQMKWSDISYHSDSQIIGRTVTTGIVTLDTNVLSVEVQDYDTNFRKDGSICYLYDLKDKTSSFTNDLKAKIIYERTLEEMPQKFLEYLEVRVALLLTEMYPRDGIDIQRLPRIERELEAYFRDRENDEGNYNIFDNYDTNARVGINRNYDII